MNILSLGAGVQSTAILLASAQGIIPKIDYAIFADTGWEPQAVYDHLDRIEKEIAQPAGIPIFRVSWRNIRQDTIDLEKPFLSMPVHVLKSNGKKVMGKRQCTNLYKVRPVNEKIRELLGAEVFEDGRIGRTKWYVQANLQIGISVDEIERAKPSKVKYVNHTFPLLDIGWSRKDCIKYLQEHGYGETPKSSCIGCPFKNRQQWFDMYKKNDSEWHDAVSIDNVIRQKQVSDDIAGVYLHHSCKPLDQAILEDEEDDKGYDLFTCSPFACSGDERQNGIELIQIGESNAHS